VHKTTDWVFQPAVLSGGGAVDSQVNDVTSCCG